MKTSDPNEWRGIPMVKEWDRWQEGHPENSDPSKWLEKMALLEEIHCEIEPHLPDADAMRGEDAPPYEGDPEKPAGGGYEEFYTQVH